MVTTLLFVPLLLTAPKQDLSSLMDGYAHRDPARTAMALLRSLGALSADERAVARFLLSTDLADLGLRELAEAHLQELIRSPGFLAPAAFLSLARLRSDADESDTLFREAKLAPWAEMKEDDFAEAAYRVGRACARTHRYPEARAWLRRVPEGSPFFPYARYVLAQAEYALGRYGRAVEAAQPIFSSRLPADSIEVLRDRTAVLLGEMFIEIGLYPYASDVLASVDRKSPFARRAERAELVARALATLDRGDMDRAEAILSRANESLSTVEREIENAVSSPEAVSARGEELERAWRSDPSRLARRFWAARRASEALETGHGWDVRRVLALVWQSFPPVILYRLVAREAEPLLPQPSPVTSALRFFFTPDREVERALAAVALLAPGERDGGCPALAARALRSRAAASLLGRLPSPGSAELLEISSSCKGEGQDDLEPAAREALLRAISDEALRRRREIRERRLALDEALAQASLDRARAITETRTSQ